MSTTLTADRFVRRPVLLATLIGLTRRLVAALTSGWQSRLIEPSVTPMSTAWLAYHEVDSTKREVATDDGRWMKHT